MTEDNLNSRNSFLGACSVGTGRRDAGYAWGGGARDGDSFTFWNSPI